MQPLWEFSKCMFPRDLVCWCAQLLSQLQSAALNTPGEGTAGKTLGSNHHHLDLYSNGNQGTELQSPSQNISMLWGQGSFPVGIMDVATVLSTGYLQMSCSRVNLLVSRAQKRITHGDWEARDEELVWGSRNLISACVTCSFVMTCDHNHNDALSCSKVPSAGCHSQTVHCTVQGHKVILPFPSGIL